MLWDGKYLYLLAEPIGASTGRKIFKYIIGGGSPSIDIPTKFFDFGNVIIGNSSQMTATIYNQGTANLIIDSLTFLYSQSFSTSLTTPTVVPPSSYINFQLIFSPQNYGIDSAYLYVYHNDFARPLS